jgi:UDPglucose 6-dehydrogenase
LLRAAESINKGRIEQFVHKIHQALWVLKGKRVGVLGLAFKPQTDDIRCSPALQLISRLLDYDVHLQAYDPQAMAKAQAEMPSIRYCESAYDAARDADALVIATEWEEFGDLNWMRVRDLMARPLIFDGRDLLDSETMAEIGFEYHGIGKPAQELGQHLYDAKSAHRQ